MNVPADEVGRLALQAAVRDAFLGAAPERAAELEGYWESYGPQFLILADDDPVGPIIMDAGGFVFVRFNHRTMRLF